MQLPILVVHVHLYHKNIRLKRETVEFTVCMLDLNLLINIGQIRPLDSHFCNLRHIHGSYSCLDKANSGGGGGEVK